VSLLRDFRKALKEFVSPDSAELTLEALKLKYSKTLRSDAAAVSALMRSKRALVAHIDHELWLYVFPSLEELRSDLASLSGKLHAKGPGDVHSAVDWMVEVLTAYLSIYHSDYTIFMQGPQYSDLPSAHKERNWPSLGSAARDLLELRRCLGEGIRNVNAFAERGEVIEWIEPEDSTAAHWLKYAEGRKFCPRCGFNLYYGYQGECPHCPSGKLILRLSFEGYLPWKGKVFVAGTFNDWNPIPMDYNLGRGCWYKVLPVPSGRYLYKFMRDGIWFTDPSNPQTEVDQNGNRNSVRMFFADSE